MNPVRFYEYALSSSLMIVLIGMLTGLWDLGAILLIFTLNATMNLFGIMMNSTTSTRSAPIGPPSSTAASPASCPGS